MHALGLPAAMITRTRQNGGMAAAKRRIVVTGGSGKLGRAVVAHLADHGSDVVNVDRVPPAVVQPMFVRADLSDYGQVVEALSSVDDRYGRVDAVVHLAAIPAPGLMTNAATFHNNMLSTYNVFAAARHASITNIVWASSETVLGLPFDTPPPYVPVDEEYAGRPESTYSLVKFLEEQMARQLCRWDPKLKMVGLRFSNVMEPADYAAFPGFDVDSRARKWNLWGYIDARDGAQAVRRALDYDVPGCEVFVIANADTVMLRPNAELLAEVFPGVPVREGVGDHDTLLSIEKARRLLGYEPQHSWRDSAG
jgi:nucleoside-diphosphate-sugar epimerase